MQSNDCTSVSHEVLSVCNTSMDKLQLSDCTSNFLEDATNLLTAVLLTHRISAALVMNFKKLFKWSHRLFSSFGHTYFLKNIHKSLSIEMLPIHKQLK